MTGKKAGGGLTHFDTGGNVRMVDVAGKKETLRQASARGEIRMRPAALRLLKAGNPKGNALATARVAAIIAAKRVRDIIPLCHSLNLDGAAVDFRIVQGGIEAEARIKAYGKTGVEMEALVAVSVALLTLYDMCKSSDRGMVIGRIRLISKSGGSSGTYRRGRPKGGRR